MSPAVLARSYDPVFHAQKHYRVLLNCVARPGTIGQLDEVQLDVPAPLNRSTSLLLLALLGTNSTFHMAQDSCAASDFIHRHTYSVATGASEAEFLVFDIGDKLNALKQANLGNLSYPDLGATVILQVEAMSPAPLTNSLKLTLTGPGIEREATVFVAGAREEFFTCLQERNNEFPLGIDAFLTCDSLSAGQCVLALPRTTSVKWVKAQS